MSNLSPDEEQCIQHHIQGLTQSESYRKTYAARVARWKDKTLHEKACRFFGTGKVVARLAELSEQAQEATGFTAEYVLAEAGAAFEKLRDNDQLKDARGYLEMVGKHKLVSAFDKTVTFQDARYANFSDAELIARHNALQKKLDEQLGGTEKLLGVIDG